jgi:hypothetical protein
MERVPRGHKGLNTANDATQHVRLGGDISDVPDDFLAEALLRNASPRRLVGPLDHANADLPVDEGARFMLIGTGDQGGMSRTLVLVQRRPDGTFGNEGFVIKAYREHSQDYALKELAAGELIHQLGAPTIPHRTNGKISWDRAPVGSEPMNAVTGGPPYSTALVMEYAWNSHPLGADLPLQDDNASAFSVGDFIGTDGSWADRTMNFLMKWLLGDEDNHEGNAISGSTADGRAGVIPIDFGGSFNDARSPSSYQHSMESGYAGNDDFLSKLREAMLEDPSLRERLEPMIRDVVRRYKAIMLDQTKGTRSSKLGTGGVYADSFRNGDKARVRAKIREHAAEMLRILDDEDSIVAQILDGRDAATQMPFFDVDESSPSDSEFDRLAAEHRRNRRSARPREIS